LIAFRRLTGGYEGLQPGADLFTQGEDSMYELKNLGKLKRLDENAPQAMKAFWSFDKAVFAPGAIDGLHKQLMAVAVALTTQCPYCIELHLKAAREAGATDQMLAETATVAAAMRAGAAITHATHLFKD
jgi:AhpD family alkylhydroperoxidase